MDRGNHLGYRGEPHSIDPNGLQESNLSTSLKRWAGEPHIDAFLNTDIVFKGNLFSKLYQAPVVYLGHVRKPGSPLIHIRSYKRIVACKIDVICDNHNVTDIKPGINTACCIGDYKSLYSQ